MLGMSAVTGRLVGFGLRPGDDGGAVGSVGANTRDSENKIRA